MEDIPRPPDDDAAPEAKPPTRDTIWRGDRGEGSIFFRLKEGRRVSENLYLSYRAEGKEQVVSTKTADLGDAKRELRRLTRNRENAREGKEPLITPKAERITVRQVVETYLDECEYEKKCVSIDSMRNHAKPLLAALGHVRALDLIPDHIARFKKGRRDKKLSDAKISRELEILKAAYNVAADTGRIRVVPFIKLPTVKNARQVFFPLERVPELVMTLGGFCACQGEGCMFEKARDYYQWLSLSGMRPKAIRLLRWDNFDEKDWILVLPAEEDKNGYGRQLPVEGEFREILDRRVAQRRPGDVYIFGSAEPIRNKFLWQTWNSAMVKMKLPSGEAGYRPYDLKKTALRALRRSGIPEERAMFFSGHRASSTFRRYNITDVEDAREDMKLVTRYRKKRFADKSGSVADKAGKLHRIP